MNTHDSLSHRPTAAHVVAQTLQFYRRHWRALLPVGLLMLPLTFMSAGLSLVSSGAGSATAAIAASAALIPLSILTWLTCQLMGTALVSTPTFPRAARRLRERLGPLCRVSVLQMGRAAWMLGKSLLLVTAVVLAAVAVPRLLPLGIGIGFGEEIILLGVLGIVALAVPMWRLQLEMLVMSQFVITGSPAQDAHADGVALCRGNLGWLFRGYLLVMLPSVVATVAATAWHYAATGSPQMALDHPALYLQAIVGCLLLPLTATFPAVAAQALRRVQVSEAAVLR